MTRKVLIAGGGTDSHIFPGLAIAGHLLEMDHEVRWLGAATGLESEIVSRAGIEISSIDSQGVHTGNFSTHPQSFSILPSAVTSALKLLLKWRPEAVLGIGGDASAPGVLAAGLLGIPWILHEQNSVPAWSNQFLSAWADAICCGFRDAIDFFPSRPAIWTGNPVRPEFFGLNECHPTETLHILILGGSHSSLFLNRSLPRVLSHLRDSGLKLHITHQTGSRWFKVVQTAYEDVGLTVELFAFLPEPWKTLENSDLVIARSSALTISEVAAAGRGALLIPFAATPVENHQEYNARSMERAGAAVVVGESDATTETLIEILGQLLREPQRLQAMGAAAKKVALPDVARRICEILLSLGNR